MKESDYAYLAGLIDGEGCFGASIHKDTRTESSSIATDLRIAMCDDEPLRWALKETGIGAIRKQSREDKRDIYTWSVGGRTAKKLVVRLLPFLKVKKGQAEKFLKLVSLKEGITKSKGLGRSGFVKYRPVEQMKLMLEMRKEKLR